jgi:RNA polymerase sigma factor (sigma-70 family)
MAYDRYAAALYGYCHWMLHDSADAAGALEDTFVIAASTLSGLSEPSRLRPWLFALARSECRRRIRPTSAARDEEAGAAARPADVAEELSDADDELSDATVQFRAVGRRPASDDELSDATVQFRVISRPGDPTTPFRVISQPAYGPGHGDQGQAELRSLIHSVLAGLKPREREVIELIFRHDLHEDDLTMTLGVSQSRAQALASRARGRLEEALGTLHIALTGREACPVLGGLLADWDGQLTEQTRDLVVWHIEDCRTCAQHGWGAMRPAAFSRLLPLAPLPPELRQQIVSRCTSTTADAVAYRRRVTRHAERIRFARFSRAIGHVSWNSIRANPGAAIAVAAVAVWVVAAVSVTLLTFAGSHAAYAQATLAADPRAAHARATQTSVGTYSRSPAATVTTPASASARPSPTVTQPSARVPTPVQPEPSRVVATSPAPSRSTSSSPRPSKSPTPSRSASPSHTASPSSSPPPAN